MSNTPRTDSTVASADANLVISLCRQLERELDIELQRNALLLEYINKIDAIYGITCAAIY